MTIVLNFGNWTHNHHYTNSLSSLHISSHQCTICASLHVKKSPDGGLLCLGEMNRTVL